MRLFVNKIVASDRMKMAATMLLVIIVLVVRKTDSVFYPQLYAEDGAVFFSEQYMDGFRALFIPYSGYLHVVPRLVALFTDMFFPYSAVPYIYNYFCILLTLLVIVAIYSTRLQLPHKELMALAIVLTPNYTNDIFLTITNIQWILAILLIITCLKDFPDRKYGNRNIQVIADLTTVIICGLTGPFIVLLAPCFALKCLRKRTIYSSVLLLTVTLAVSAQLYCIAQAATLRRTVPIEGWYGAGDYVQILGQRIFGNLFLGVWLPYHIDKYLLCSLFLIVIVFVLYLSLSSSRDNFKYVLAFMYFGVSIIFSLLYKTVTNTELIVTLPHFNTPGWCQRYFYLPYLMIAWSLIVCLNQKSAWKKHVVICLLLLIVVSSLSSGFHSDPQIDFSWQIYSKLIAKENIMIPINPQGWIMYLPQK